MKGSKTIFVCRECGCTNFKWLGKCPDCGAWNSFDEELIREEKKTKETQLISQNKAERLSDLIVPTYLRTNTGMGELDRVLGGWAG